jgi:hypothetical protein
MLLCRDHCALKVHDQPDSSTSNQPLGAATANHHTTTRTHHTNTIKSNFIVWKSIDVQG